MRFGLVSMDAHCSTKVVRHGKARTMIEQAPENRERALPYY